MTRARTLPAAVEQNQAAASNPETSVWVSANAGSGKTHVLVQRVIRLLLDGVDPGKILCLTFTKAAAANMANRVFETLARWTALDDAALDAALSTVENRKPGPERRLRARRLFAEALETPGGLKVQTIHAFCTALLHQFPFEADVAAGFEVLEERAERELIDRIRLHVLLDAAAAPQTRLGRALTTAMTNAADITFANVVRDAVGQRHALDAWFRRTNGLDGALEEISQSLGVSSADTLSDTDAEILASPILPRADWAAVGRFFASGGPADREQAKRLARATAGQDWEHIEAYLQIFCTGDLQPRKSIATAAARARDPGLFARLQDEQTRICALIAKRRAIVLRDRSQALVCVAAEVLARYRAEKARRGLLDYDDLIEKTLALLDESESAAAWVLYKLDRGIDHVLIDEAQDTSPQQWEVIRKLTAEFFAGEGARGRVHRSVFAVGDEKQSIYSFQGAEPDRFASMRRHYESVHRDVGLAFAQVPLQYSFRSAPVILEAVDAVFKRPDVFTGLTADAVETVHAAVRHNTPGEVEVWSLVEPEQKPPIEPWQAPFDAVSESSPPARLARKIALAVRRMISRGDSVGDARRPVQAGDILILVRQRGPLFEGVIRALKNLGVAVAGADRLQLTEHIAVMDLMSLADALLLPQDDLALAEALKSPLFGFDDDAIFTLAHGRRSSLRRTLHAKASDDPRFAEAAAVLDRLATAAREQTPFAFFAELLGAGGGRRKMLARLGLEASDALDEFLALALDYESRHTPSLQGFLAWLRASEAEVKRDMDIVRDEVRVMTIHGAKGLEAPVVFLVETTSNPTGPRDPALLALSEADDAPLVWAAGQKTDTPPVAAARALARQAADNEHRRLLYVAMTRAADRLIVCGHRGEKRPPERCWYNIVHAALTPDASEVQAEDGDGTVWRWRKSEPDNTTVQGTLAFGEGQPSVAAPAWLGQAAPAARRAPPPLAPSRAISSDSRKGGGDAEAARRRGLIVHRLLQALPAVSSGNRENAAKRFLLRHARWLEPGDSAELLRQVEAVLANPAFAPLFVEGSQAEVALVGRLACVDGTLAPVSGQIDRLAIKGDSVLIADFKTDGDIPRRLEDVPEAYRAQLALYRALLAKLYPGRTVRAALVFTAAPALIEIPTSALDAALLRLGVIAP